MKNFFKIIFYRINYLLILMHRIFSSGQDFDKNKIKRILICETALLGDIVCVHPLIDQVYKSFPNATIDILVQKKFKSIAAYNPKITNIICLNKTSVLNIVFLILKLWKKQFDLLIAPSPGLRNSIIVLLSAGFSGKSFVTGYLFNSSFKPVFFQNHQVESPNMNHKYKYKYNKIEHLTIRSQKSLLPLINFPCIKKQAQLSLDSNVEIKHINFLKQKGIFFDGKKILVIHPAASQSFKIWPGKNFIRLITILQNHFPNQLVIVLIGVGKEAKIIWKIKKKIKNNIMILLDHPLDRVITLIKNCDLFIGNDSGPKFIADGFNIPVIELMGSLSPETAGVVNPDSLSFYANVNCSPCDQTECLHNNKCLKAIQPEWISNSAIKMLINESVD